MRHEYFVNGCLYIKLFSNKELDEEDIFQYMNNLNLKIIEDSESRDTNGKFIFSKNYNKSGLTFEYIFLVEPIEITIFSFTKNKFSYFVQEKELVLNTLLEKNIQNFEKMKFLVMQIIHGLQYDKESSIDRIDDFEEKTNEYKILSLLLSFVYSEKNYDLLLSILKIYIQYGFKSSTLENLYKKG